MDDTQAHKIISALADGCDPTTGEKVEDSVLQHGDVIRALHIAIRALEASARSKGRGRRARTPANAGKPWTEQEDRALLEKFDAGQTVAQLAQAHDRTAAGIHARLERHGRLQGPSPQSRGRSAHAAVGALRRERSGT
jgi:hypothetical protein